MRYLTVHDIALIVMLLVLVGSIGAALFVPSTPNRGVPGGPETGTNMWQ